MVVPPGERLREEAGRVLREQLFREAAMELTEIRLWNESIDVIEYEYRQDGHHLRPMSHSLRIHARFSEAQLKIFDAQCGGFAAPHIPVAFQVGGVWFEGEAYLVSKNLWVRQGIVEVPLELLEMKRRGKPSSR
jgi:hypothetical protein